MCVIDRCHISSKRLECREHRAREASLEHGGYKGRVDPVRETRGRKTRTIAASRPHTEDVVDAAAESASDHATTVTAQTR